MDKKTINILDGNPEERTKAMKEFFGLSPKQSFQDLTIEDSDVENEEKSRINALKGSLEKAGVRYDYK